MIKVFLVSFLLYLLVNRAFLKSEKSDKCTICKDFTTKFFEGLQTTAASNFGGGNTNWEEKNLGSYTFSETRLLEILDGSCSETNKHKCHELIEVNDELLEKWWFKHFAKGIDLDLFLFLCVESLKSCCPNGMFGKNCEECPGGSNNPCYNNGICEGIGTRMGSGKCKCNHGYYGDTCDECQPLFYQDNSSDKMKCLACHPACKTSCKADGPSFCLDCKDGWTQDAVKGCLDINECEQELANCSHGTYCSNIEGSYNCPECHPACNGCTSYGHNQCLMCNSRYFLDEEICKECHPSCNNSCTDGSASTCDTCKIGWRLIENNECSDIDECMNNEDNNCASNTYCLNSPGSFACLSCHNLCLKCTNGENFNCSECKVGYAPNEEGTCIDIDECTNSESCVGEFETCVNTEGGFNCDCMEGYVRRMGSECFKKNIVKKKVKKDTKEKAPPVTLKDVDEIKPGPDGFTKEDLERLGKPLDGNLMDEPIVMEGSTQNIRDSSHDDL